MYFSGITSDYPMQIELLRSQEFPHIPSGSGIEKWQDKVYIIGDDSNFLFELNNEWELSRTIRLFDRPVDRNDRIPKPIKPDLEAVTLVPPNHLLALGSGSLPELRDVGVLINLAEQDEPEYLSFNDLYDQLRGITAQLNIEGACNIDDTIILLNRGDADHSNQVIIANWNRKQLVMENLMDIHFVELPQIEQTNAGFTGCVHVPEMDTMIFCASAEETNNAYDDGKVKGSLIGIVKNFSGQLRQKHLKITASVIPAFFKEKKIESVCVDEFISENEITLLAVADSDDGSSEVFRLRLTL
jgi:hypothetical protein